MAVGVAAQRRHPAAGLPDVHADRHLRRARGAGAGYRLPPDAAAVRVRRRRLQDQGVQLPAAAVSVYAAGTLGLCAHGAVSSRVAVDRVGVRRPDGAHMELAEPVVLGGAHRAQPLRDERLFSPAGGSGAIGVAGSDGARVGHIRAERQWHGGGSGG
eukprot:ctg_757.g352